MFVARRIDKMLRRNAPHKDFPPVAIEDGLIFLEDTDKRSYIGACFAGHTLVGMDEMTRAKFVSALEGYPPDTFVQIQQISVPDIDDYAEAYLDGKLRACNTSEVMTDEQRVALREIATELANYFKEGKTEPHIRSTGMRLHRIIQLVNIKIPVRVRPTDEDIETARDLIEKFEQNISTTGFPVARQNAGGYLGKLRLFFDPFAREDYVYDEIRELREQVLPPGYGVDNSETDILKVGDVYVKLLSPKQYPSNMSIGHMDMLQGEPGGINNQVPIPWVMSLSIRLPDRNRKASWFDLRFKSLTFQAGNPNILKWVPRLAAKKADADLLKSEFESGQVPCEMCLTYMLYSRDRKELNRVSAQMTTYAAGLQFKMVEDSEILWPLFWNTLPLFPSDTSIKYMERHWSMSIRQALQAAPCTSEWTGSQAGSTMLLETRRQLPFCFDLYATRGNFNALCFAQSGKGKTTVMQHLIMNYLAEGARIWVVDIGRGYFKLAKALGGQFWSFDEDSNICLNPFSSVEEIDEEMDMLVALLSKMAAAEDGLGDVQRAGLQEAIKAVWSSMGNSMTVSNVSNWLTGSEDPRLQDVGKMLYPFTSHGQFGIWFEGENNLKFTSNFIVLELEELTQKPLLQKVVLMILMARIQHDMFHTLDSVKKISIFDESWALFDDPGVATYLNHAFRRFRRYNGSAILVFQSIGDVYAREDLRAVAENAETKIILEQAPESIERAVESKQLDLDAYGVAELKKVHTAPDVYSEIMFYRDGAWSIARLVLPRFFQLLYSSKGDERTEIIKAVEAGVPVHEAIHNYIQFRG